MLRRCRYALLLAVAIASTGIPSALSAGLTASSLNNATAHAPDMEGDGTHPVKFKNGANDNGSGTDKIVKTAVGDLNGDRLDDGAIVYYEDWGGTGAFMRMSVFLCKSGKPVQIGYRTLGDRSKTNKLEIRNKAVFLDIMTHGPNDAANNPRHHQRIYFHVKNEKLVGLEDVNR